MELIDGEDIDSTFELIAPVSKARGARIARELFAGLVAMHEPHFIHRDLKPANVMLDRQGCVRITDLGLAIMEGSDHRELAGTPLYMAPEVRPGGPATKQSDVYSAGLILFELFTGLRVKDLPPGTSPIDAWTHRGRHGCSGKASIKR